MKYKIEWIEVDKYGNKRVSVTREDGSKLLSAELGKEYKDVDVAAGQDINAKEWQSPKNSKIYLFMDKEPQAGEKPRGGAYSAFKGQVIAQAQDRKNEMIGKTMDRKDISIKVSSTMRDAVQLAIAEGLPNEEAIEKWRAWLWLNWDKEDKDFPPFK